MKTRICLSLIIGLGLLAAVSCSSGTPTTTGPGAAISLVAQSLKFNTSTITVAAGASVTINFNNKDAGIQHNFALYTSGNSSGTASGPIYIGPLVLGPGTATYTFTAPSTPGTYFFRCDVHPTMMYGNFIVT